MTGLFLVFIAMVPFCAGRAIFLVMDGLYLQAFIMACLGLVLGVWAYQLAPGRE